MLAVLVLAGILLYIVGPSSSSRNNSEKNRFELLIVTVGLLSNGALFLFSGRFSQITGYGNRGLTSSWIIFSILIVMFFGSKATVKIFALMIFVSANYLLFWDKLVESASASSARSQVISQLIDSSVVRDSNPSTLILKVPCILPNSKFRTEIFCTAWDARGALKKNGLDLENVFLLDDRGFTNYLQNLAETERVTIVEFTTDFKVLSTVDVGFESREETFAPYSKRLKEREAVTKDCITRVKALFGLQIPSNLRSYSDCVKPLLIPDE
jgi:hypothetical protein